jgi:opacity protein-like surface antigen
MITITCRICRRLVAMAVLFTTVATFGTGAASAAEDGLSYSITPYLWATAMKGDVQGGRLPETSVDMSFSDILDVLDFGFMTAVEVRKGRLGFLFDGIYMKVSDSAEATGPRGALTVSADAEVRQTMLAFAAAWRVLDDRVSLDAVGGIRYNRIEVDADIDASLFGLLEGSVSRSVDKDWVDPYVGVRVYVPVTDALRLVGYLDAGGFGVGSDFTWHGLAGLEYALSETFAASLGYRYMHIDYDQDGFRHDMVNEGPYAGLTMRF